MWNRLLPLCVLYTLGGQSAASRVVNLTVPHGALLTLPCGASVSEGFIFRVWWRGYESLTSHSATPLYHQVGGVSPERLPGARSDMEVDAASFNLTLTCDHGQDNVVFTCMQYKEIRHTYSYIHLQVKEAGSLSAGERTGLVVGVCVGVLLLLLTTGGATYRLRQRRAGSGRPPSSGTETETEDMSVGFATGTSTVRLYDKRD